MGYHWLRSRPRQPDSPRRHPDAECCWWAEEPLDASSRARPLENWHHRQCRDAVRMDEAVRTGPPHQKDSLSLATPRPTARAGLRERGQHRRLMGPPNSCEDAPPHRQALPLRRAADSTASYALDWRKRRVHAPSLQFAIMGSTAVEAVEGRPTQRSVAQHRVREIRATRGEEGRELLRAAPSLHGTSKATIERAHGRVGSTLRRQRGAQ